MNYVLMPYAKGNMIGISAMKIYVISLYKWIEKHEWKNNPNAQLISYSSSEYHHYTFLRGREHTEKTFIDRFINIRHIHRINNLY